MCRNTMGGATYVMVLMTAAVCSCAGDTPDPSLPSFEVTDSAGVPIVWNAGPDGSGPEAWMIVPEPSLVIGEVEGEEPYQLSAVGDVIEYPDGRIGVVDEQAVEIRVFGPDGRHLWTVGGRGEGPGTFSAAPTLALGKPDTLVAWDGRTRRVTWFDGNGELIAERSLRERLGELGIGSSRAALQRDGSILLGDRERIEESGGRAWTIWRPIILRTAAEPPIPIGDFPDDLFGGVPSEQISLLAPFGHAIWTVADARGGFVLTPVRAWELRRFGPDGALNRVVRAAVPRLPITSAMLEAEAAARAERTGLSVSLIHEAYDRMGVYDSLPAIGGIVPDTEGGIWVERYDAVGAGPAIWDVFDAGGRWLQTLQTSPEMGEIIAIGLSRVYFRWRDALDVPYVRGHEFARPE